MADNATLGLKEPDQVDWENYNPGTKFMAPPPAKGADGKAVVYYGLTPDFSTLPDGRLATEEATDEGLLQVIVDPIKIVKSGPGADGYELRFTRINVRQFEKNGKKVNASSMGNYLRAAGIQAKPQKNTEYRAAVKMSAKRVVPFTVDWFAKNKDTGEQVQGYDNFPLDPERPGQRKAILKTGDTYTVSDKMGNITETKVVKSEVLFANARVRYFIDPSKVVK